MSAEEHYDDQFAAFLEEIWGEGFMSPGGPEEVARVLEDLDLAGKRVLDIGCGTGAIVLLLARDHGAAEVVGIDVEDTVCRIARERAEAAGLADRIEIVKVHPGPFPFPDESFDIVFSKDSIIHIPDKEGLAAEVFRILKPGGHFAASDWLISHDGDPSPEMARYIELEGLDFAMASPERYARALRAAGFEDVRTVNRNPWYLDVARHELDILTGPRNAEFGERFGPKLLKQNVEVWTAMIRVLETGEHCPHHLRGRKP
jgi:phosphoethanolamine N-methyltransferase